jgi:chromosome segregation ATPase
MAGETKQTTKKAQAEIGPQSTDTLVDEFHAWFREYAGGDSFSLLRTKLKEVDALTEKNTRLQTAYDEAIDQFAKREAKQAGEKEQQQKVLENSKKNVDGAAEANKRLKEELAKQRAARADREAQVEEQEARIQGMIAQSKRQETEIERLRVMGNERDGLRKQLMAVTKQIEATGIELAEARQSLDFVRAHAVYLTPIQEDKEGVYVHPQP